MDPLNSTRFRCSYASTPSIAPSAKLATVCSEHLPTTLRLSDTDSKRDENLPLLLLGPSSGISALTKRLNKFAERNETGKAASEQRARERLHAGTVTHHHFPKSCHQYVSERGEGPSNLAELNIALRTSRRCWASLSTIDEEEEEASDNDHASYTCMKEWGRLPTQVGQRLLDATRKNKVLVSCLQTYYTSHTLTRPLLFSSSSSWFLALPFFIPVLLVNPEHRLTGWTALPF